MAADGVHFVDALTEYDLERKPRRLVSSAFFFVFLE
jgi:hypothetical protein